MSFAEPRPFTRTTFAITGALLIWMANFVCVYVLAALACARGFYDAQLFGLRIVPLATAALTVLAAVVTGLLAWRALQREVETPTARFIRFVHWATSVIALAGLVLMALPSLFLREAACY